MHAVKENNNEKHSYYLLLIYVLRCMKLDNDPPDKR